MDEIAENEYCKFYKKDGILFGEYKGKVSVTGEIAKKAVELRHQISHNTNQYWCLDTKGIKSFDKEARDYSDKYGQDFLFACATVVDSHVTKFMFSAYYKLKKSKIPLQVFKDRNQAIKWLLEIKAQNEKNNQ